MPTVLFTDYVYAGLVAGFEAARWRVLASDDLRWYARAHGNLSTVPKMSGAEYGAYLRGVVQRERVDLVLLGKVLDSNVQAQDQSPPYWHLRAEDVELIKSDGAVVLYLDLDSPDSTGWVVQSGLHRAVDAIGNCCVGTRDVFKNHGQPNLFEFWPGWDQAARATFPARGDRPVDFLMVGSPYLTPNPDFGIPRRDVVLAAVALGLKVELYGNSGWLHPHLGGDPSLAEVYRGEAEFNDLHLLMSRAKVVYSSFLRRGFRYLNDRVPIAAGAGAFLLMEEQLGLEGEFPEGVMCGYHRRGNLDSFRARLAHWVADDAGRVAAAERMQAHVLARHTWSHRAESLVAEYHGAVKRREAARPGCCRGG